MEFWINLAVATPWEITAEAVKRIPDSLDQLFIDSMDKDGRGMGLFHGFDNVDLQIIWDGFKRDIPKNKPQNKRNLVDCETPAEE